MTFTVFSRVQAEFADSATLAKSGQINVTMPAISGIINTRYRYTDNAGTFDIRRARASLKGSFSKILTYRLHADFAGTPRLLDAWLNVRVADFLNLKFGEFKHPFSVENQYAAQELETAEYSMIINRLAGFDDLSGIASAGRDIGVNVYGSFFKCGGRALFAYSAGLFNGNGINVADNNRRKDFAGSLSVAPVQNLLIAVSHYNGSTGAPEVEIRRIRTGAGLKYDDKTFLFRSEYIGGTTGDMKSGGAYALAGYYVYSGIQLVLQYDWFKEDFSARDSRRINYVAAVNWLPLKNLRLQFNFSLKTAVGTANSNYFALQTFVIY